MFLRLFGIEIHATFAYDINPRESRVWLKRDPGTIAFRFLRLMVVASRQT